MDLKYLFMHFLASQVLEISHVKTAPGTKRPATFCHSGRTRPAGHINWTSFTGPPFSPSDHETPRLPPEDHHTWQIQGCVKQPVIQPSLSIELAEMSKFRYHPPWNNQWLNPSRALKVRNFRVFFQRKTHHPKGCFVPLKTPISDPHAIEENGPDVDDSCFGIDDINWFEWYKANKTGWSTREWRPNGCKKPRLWYESSDFGLTRSAS